MVATLPDPTVMNSVAVPIWMAEVDPPQLAEVATR